VRKLAKAKSKKWYKILAPRELGNIEIGETLSSDPNYLIGRRITLNGLEIDESTNKFYMKFYFRIDKVEGDRAYTLFDGSECLRDYISRMVVRRVTRIDVVQDVKMKDGVVIRVKSIIVVPRKATSTVKKSIRKTVKEIVEKEVSSRELKDMIGILLTDSLKEKVLKEIKKIYPIRNYEIRKTEVIGS